MCAFAACYRDSFTFFYLYHIVTVKLKITERPNFAADSGEMFAGHSLPSPVLSQHIWSKQCTANLVELWSLLVTTGCAVCCRRLPPRTLQWRHEFYCDTVFSHQTAENTGSNPSVDMSYIYIIISVTSKMTLQWTNQSSKELYQMAKWFSISKLILDRKRPQDLSLGTRKVDCRLLVTSYWLACQLVDCLNLHSVFVLFNIDLWLRIRWKMIKNEKMMMMWEDMTCVLLRHPSWETEENYVYL
jgi:hypothetical protein